jgi:hypothetical protein
MADVQTFPMEVHLKYIFKGKMFSLNWDQQQALLIIE